MATITQSTGSMVDDYRDQIALRYRKGLSKIERDELNSFEEEQKHNSTPTSFSASHL